MKAEHRKELETNVLADRMGRLVQRMKTRPQRRFFLYIIGILILGIGLFIFVQAKKASALESSERWRELEDGFRPFIDDLRDKYKDINPGKAARFQWAYLATWDSGLMVLGASPVQALRNMKVAEFTYKELKEECAGDPIWEPEAMYALAVIEETRAIRPKDRSHHLERAKKLYKELADKYQDSAHGKMAKKRAKLLEEKGREVAEFYADLESRLDVEKQFAEAEKAPPKRAPGLLKAKK